MPVTAGMSELPAGEEIALAEAFDRYVRPNARWSREGEFFHVRRYGGYFARVAEPGRMKSHRQESLQ